MSDETTPETPPADEIPPPPETDVETQPEVAAEPAAAEPTDGEVLEAAPELEPGVPDPRWQPHTDAPAPAPRAPEPTVDDSVDPRLQR